MEVERERMMDTSRLYKILVTEREREELAKLDPKGLSAFKTVKRNLCRKLSFNKVKKDKYNKVEEVPKKQKSTHSSEQSKSQRVFQKVTSTIRNSFRSRKVKDCETLVDESDEDLSSARDSAYFSLTQSCLHKSESDTLEETEAANNSFDYLTTLSRTSSFTTSPIPILVTSSLTRKVPKKSVTSLLPNSRSREKTFGVYSKNVLFSTKMKLSARIHIWSSKEYPISGKV
jgi:hypothetical protein